MQLHLTNRAFLLAVGIPNGFFYLSPFPFSFFSKRGKTVSLFYCASAEILYSRLMLPSFYYWKKNRGDGQTAVHERAEPGHLEADPCLEPGGAEQALRHMIWSMWTGGKHLDQGCKGAGCGNCMLSSPISPPFTALSISNCRSFQLST